jgi:anthranilate synthase component 2
MKKLLLIDNYDSFTYNLVQYFQELGIDVVVKRNDKISILEAKKLKIDYLVFSPGPGTVENLKDIGIGPDLFKEFYGEIPILGVCLGQQMIGYLLGGKIIKVKPQHGKRWDMRVLDKSGLFKGFDDNFEGMRYHSMVVERASLPLELKISAETNDKEKLIMAFENLDKKVFGVQFHPESVGTKTGMKILKNFLNY